MSLHFSSGLKFPQKVVKVFRLPDFPPPLAYQYVQNYYTDMVSSLKKAIETTSTSESALLARYSAVRTETTPNVQEDVYLFLTGAY